jgi:hypothetical protein
MQEKLKIGETVTFIMNGQPFNPGQQEKPPAPPEEKKEEKKEEVKEISE